MTELPTFPGYQVLARLGEDRTGDAFRARRASDERTVAILTLAGWESLIPPERDRFLAQIAPLRALDHPAIARLLEANVEHRPPFVAVDLCEGIPLAECARTLPLPAVAELMEKLARAVHHAHRAGVLHGDLHPDAVRVRPHLVPQLVDFGLARAYACARTTRTRRGAYVGHPAWAAPEQLGGAPASAATDVYALGAILYEILTGHPPKGDAPALPRDARPEIPEPLQRVCLKALERVPALRYGSAEALAGDLRLVLQGRDVAVRPTVYARRLDERLRQHLAEVERWHAERFLDRAGRERLVRAVAETRPAAAPGRGPTGTGALMALGIALVALASAAGLTALGTTLPPAARAAAAGLPAVLAALLAVAARRDRDLAAGLWAASLAALGPALAMLLSAVRYAPLRISPHEILPAGLPTSFQMAVAALAGLVLSAVAARLSGRAVFVYLCAAYFAATYAGATVHLGVRFPIEDGRWAEAALWVAPLGAASLGIALLLDGAGRPSWAAPFLGLGLAVLLAAAAILVVRAPAGDANLPLVATFAASAAACGACAWAGRSRLPALRAAGRAGLWLAPAGLVAPLCFLRDVGPPWRGLGVGVEPAWAALVVAALALAGLGVATRSRGPLVWAVAGLAAFVWLGTRRHFPHAPAWPAALLAAGVLLAAAALWRARRR